MSPSSKSPWLSRILALATVAAAAGCSMLATRPVQEMSDTAAAIRAAREVQADTLAPELYRQSNEWFFKAKHEYKLKNFSLAASYADKARTFAEDAEFEAIRNGGNRSGDVATTDPLANGLSGPSDKSAPAPQSTPYTYPTPTGTPADAYGNGAPGGSPGGAGGPGGAPGGPGPVPTH
jgi:hypothetical protein